MYTPMQRIEQAKVSLFRDPRFSYMAGLFMIGKTTVTNEVHTARTNGRDVEFNPEFVQSLDDAELRGLVYHEYGGHIMYRHLSVFKFLYEQDGDLANRACDYVVNQIIKDFNDPRFIKLPKGGLQDDRFRGMDSKQVFDILKKEQEEGGDFGDEGGFDEHDWKGAQELSDEDKKVLEREIDQALRQGLIAHNKVVGAGGGGLNRELGDLLNPQVDRREVLREFVKSVCSKKETSSWRRVNRRYLATGTLMPTLIGESIGSMLIGIDTSGSIGVAELNEFLSEVKSICEDVSPSKLDLIYWDGEVAGHEVYDGSDVTNVTSSTKPRGGGGTDPTCVIRYMKEKGIKPEVIVMLTDGCID